MKIKLLLGAALVVIIALFVIVMITKDSKSSVIEMNGGNLVISGSFGTTVPLDAITGLDQVNIPPQIAKKTNGLGIGTIYKGEFQLTDEKKARLYIDTANPPFIVFYYDDVVFYINLETSDETNALYEKITEEVE